MMEDDSGAPTRMVGTAQDITDQRRAEETLRRFIANASHELRTPLTTVWGYAEALARNGRDLPPDVFDEFLATLGREGKRARHLLENLLDLSRAEQGHRESPPEPEPLAAAARRVIETVPPPAGTTVEVLAPDDVLVPIDGESLERILVNLLTNAYKYGGSQVRVDGRSQDDEVRVAVADDGPGVPAEAIAELFEPFTRGPGAPGMGSGLGLAITRGLVESFGGKISYEPGEPSGARFEIALDIHPDDARDRDLLCNLGWSLLDPREASGDPYKYRTFLQTAVRSAVLSDRRR
jgi:signal transduction histidine kinase